MSKTNATTKAYTANSQNQDIDVQDANLVTVSISGTFVATLGFFVSDDGGTTYYPIAMTPVSGAAAATTATAGGLWKADVTPFGKFRLGTTAYTSGTANARIVSNVVPN